MNTLRRSSLLKKSPPLLASLALALAPLAVSAEDKPGTRNDQMYPPAAAAADAIRFDGAGFIVNGQRTYLSSGTIHYPRVPNELWRDRLLRMKNADFVNVETYCFWNYHEPRENEWNFSGDGDLEKFLDTAKEVGLTSIVRVGPYVCAEWEAGGWPLWLRFKPTMNLRTADPEFLKWNTHWYDKILPIVAKHQIHKGGNVIMLQLENEHPLGWGVVAGDPYFDNLHEQAVKHQIKIPWFFSGLNHGGNPAPGDIDPTKRSNPWFSTEFWAGWFDSYGLVAEKKLRAIEKANWSIMARGGGGQNYYMLHGGSNFDSWSDNSTASSYDFGAAIGQAGDLRPSYYKMKRANLLAQSFPEILANSVSVFGDYKNAVSGNKVELHGARRSDAGTLLFLRNNDNKETTATFADGGALRLPRYTTVAVPRNLSLPGGVKIVSSTLPILCRATNGEVTTIAFYGQPGETGALTLATPENHTVSLVFTVSLVVPESGIARTMLDLPGCPLRVLAISQDLSLRAWRLGPPAKQLLVFGPAFVQDAAVVSGQPVVTYERYMGQPAPGQIAVFGGKGEFWSLATVADTTWEKLPAPALAPWRALPADAPARPDFDDSAWFASDQPQQMGADGDNSSHAWYRAKVTAPKAAAGKFSIKAKDNCLVFVNGKLVTGNGDTFRADFLSGANTIAVFVSHAGRNKGFNYCKPAAELDPKGLLASVTLDIDKQQIPVTGWRMHGGPGAPAIWTAPDTATGWQPAAASSGVPTFYRSSFTAPAPASAESGPHPIFRLKWTGLSRGMVWVNGHSLGRYPEKIRVDSLYVPEPWIKPGVNDVVIFDDTGASPSAVHLVIDAASREIVRASAPVSDDTPFVVPQEFPIRDYVAMNKGNIAFNVPATASSEASKDNPASAATDGDPETMWKAAGKIEPNVPNPWLAVNLGKSTPLGTVEIVWDGESKNFKYLLESSDDGQTWKKIGDQTTAVPTSPDSPSDLSRLNLGAESATRLRVTLTEARNLAICEFRVFPPQK